MRLLRRTCTNLRTRKRSSAAVPSATSAASGSAYALKRASPARRDAVASVVKQFHALTLDQRNRAVNRVLQRTHRVEEDIEQLFSQADKDRDGLLNKQEFRAFFTSRFSLKAVQASPDSTSVARPTNDQLKLVMIASAIPFVGFGFVDNIIMLAAGDMIEDHFHATYHISMLCAAALGNTVSDVVGLSLGGIIETFARKIGIPDPQLSKAQANMSITHWCNFFASAGGITIGCLLGMFPLLFMNHSDESSSGEIRTATQPVEARPRDASLASSPSVVIVRASESPAAGAGTVADGASSSSDHILSFVAPHLDISLA